MDPILLKSLDGSLTLYEQSLRESKDERDATQQKTFTKWVNKYLAKRNERINDLFEDLKSGQHLLTLLELLSGQKLPRERGKMRVHRLQNIQIALNFIRMRKVRLVNIRPEEIVDGNQKLTLGLIWTIILHFHLETDNFREVLLKWAQRTTSNYPGCHITDLTSSWRDGLAMNAIIHRNRPDLINFKQCRNESPRDNLERAFNIAERELGVTRLLDPEDVDVAHPDEKSMITYLSQLYELFPDPTDRNPLLDSEIIRRIDEFKELSSLLLKWIIDSTQTIEQRNIPSSISELRSLIEENDRFSQEEIPAKEHDKQRLASLANEVNRLASEVGVNIPDDIQKDNIEYNWKLLIKALEDNSKLLNERLKEQVALDEARIKHEKKMKQIQEATREFESKLDTVRTQLDELQHRVDSLKPADMDPQNMQDQISAMQLFNVDLEKSRSDLNDIVDLADSYTSQGLFSNPQSIRNGIKDCQAQIARLEESIQKRLKSIQEAMVNRENQDKAEAEFDQFAKEICEWLDNLRKEIEFEENVYGDLDTVNALIAQHRAFEEELIAKKTILDDACRLEARVLNNPSPSELVDEVRKKSSSIATRYNELQKICSQRSELLQDAHNVAESFHNSINKLLEWLAEAELKFRFSNTTPDDETACNLELDTHEDMLRNLAQQSERKDQVLTLANNILSRCHPDAEPILRHWINVLETRWEEIEGYAHKKGEKLKQSLSSFMSILDLVNKLIDYLSDHESRLLAEEAEVLPDKPEILEASAADHQLFLNELSSHETDIEKVVKIFALKSNTSTSKTILHSLTTKSRPESRASSGRFSAGSRSVTPNSRTSYATYRDEYPQIKHPRAQLMLDKWRSVWQLALDKLQMLKDRSDYLDEIDRLINFNFDDWRRRFLTWMNDNKARVMDFFRTIDKDNDGRIPIQDFIEGVMRSNFNTSRLEMDKVAHIFDRNSDGTIDNKEYLDTLRPDKPITDDEVIQDEVQRQVSKCTCNMRYKVYHVGESKYRFGESQKLRLVRILRSKVMVRVGGGWEALEEFLQKNDPCRIKNRTNVELREQFILPEGSAQAMIAFKSKMSNLNSSTIKPQTGPVTKIREKTDRSMPMSSTMNNKLEQPNRFGFM